MYFSLLRKIELNNEFRKICIFTKFFKFAVFFSTEKDRIKQRIFKNSYFYENFKIRRNFRPENVRNNQRKHFFSYPIEITIEMS